MSYDKLYNMKFEKIYKLFIDKAIKKSRTEEEVIEIICWLTSYTKAEIENAIKTDVNYKEFFLNAPKMNENRHLIKGSICGIKLEQIEDELIRDIRYLDKLIDELAKGKSMEKILRTH
ncbi:MAG: DUF2200 domain-containing protein [Cellulosilyticaceae bacterium]